MQGNPIGWFEIYVQDMRRACQFYQSVFNVELQKLTAPSSPGTMDKYGAAGSLVKMEGAPSGGGGTLVYFSCADCSVEAERAAKHGGRIFRPKMSIGEHGFIALLMDTEGNMIGLHSMQ